MAPEDVSDEWVAKASEARHAYWLEGDWPDDIYTHEDANRIALAAVLPDIRAAIRTEVLTEALAAIRDNGGNVFWRPEHREAQAVCVWRLAHLDAVTRWKVTSDDDPQPTVDDPSEWLTGMRPMPDYPYKAGGG